jgi:pilus assembly protein CpaE
MKHKLSVLISTRDRAELEALKTAVVRDCPEFGVDARLVSNGHVDPLHAITALPDVLLLSLSANWQDELQEVARRPAGQRPPMVLIAPGRDPEMMRLAMQAGARDFYTRPIDHRHIIAALQQIAAEKSMHSGDGGRLTAFINAKGGSGATLLAANVAQILAAEMGKRVALVDLDIQFGSLALYLDLNPASGVLDAMEYAGELDAVALEAYMETHRSGLRVLGTVHRQMPLPDDIHISQLQRLFDVLVEQYDHVVIDLPHQIDAVTTTVMEQVDKVVITTQQGVTDLRDASRLRSILYEDLGVSDDRLLVAVNRYDSKNPITLADITEALGCTLQTHCIANDHKRVRENVNLGITLHEQKASAPITRSLAGLARALCDDAGRPRPTGAGILARVFGKSPHSARSLS